MASMPGIYSLCTCEIVPVSHARALLLSNFCVEAASDARARHLLEFLGGTF